ncbi:MAG: IS66 family transposase zinc-finger binding domain-containing protein, partial [Acidobacteriia bacterium]|nr:IS66 family transposase zinc-finger binding domain-containing protein [Terriglobia bacterium]
PTTVIGYETSEQLDVEPAKYFVVVTKREKRACHHGEQGGVAAAPTPARIIEKGLVSDRVVIDTVISKYSDHLPLYRQSVMLEPHPFQCPALHDSSMVNNGGGEATFSDHPMQASRSSVEGHCGHAGAPHSRLRRGGH